MDYSILGIEPISEELPAGSDVRYETDFDALQTEMDKLASPAGRETFSWSKVVDLASKILETQSKDLLVASYLSVALMHTESGKGLDIASKIMDDLISTYWDTLFPPPKRLRGRISALEWWVEKTESALENDFQLNVEPEVTENILERFSRIDAFLENNPDFKFSVLKIINTIKTSAPTVEKKEEKPSVSSAPVISNTSSNLDIELTDPAEVLKNMAPLFQKVRQASKILRDDKMHNPQSYRWLRFGLWEPIKNMPAATDGVTKLQPPTQQLLTQLENLKNTEEWEDLIAASESALNNPKNIFLLDLNRYTSEALSNLGRRYEHAFEAVTHETYLFTKRLPGVENLSFSDGTPFASEDTKQWLKGLGSGTAGETENDISSVLSNEDNTVSKAIDEAKQLAKDGNDISEAVNFLQQKINNCFSKKESLLLRTGLVQILTSNKNEKFAVSHLDTILDDILTFKLDIWEPNIALGCLKKVYTAYKKHPDKHYQQKADNVFNIISNISTVDAMKL